MKQEHDRTGTLVDIRHGVRANLELRKPES